jgi:hypothetical protein
MNSILEDEPRATGPRPPRPQGDDRTVRSGGTELRSDDAGFQRGARDRLRGLVQEGLHQRAADQRARRAAELTVRQVIRLDDLQRGVHTDDTRLQRIGKVRSLQPLVRQRPSVVIRLRLQPADG